MNATKGVTTQSIADLRSNAERLSSLLALDRLLRYAEAEAISLEQDTAADLIDLALRLLEPGVQKPRSRPQTAFGGKKDRGGSGRQGN